MNRRREVAGATMTVEDRSLTYAEYGDPNGRPLLYLHGTPSSRLEPLAFGLDATASRIGVRVIAPDRPGMGGSTFHPGRTIAGTVGDLAALLEHLALDRVDLLGYSGGGPYAAAAAALLGERVIGCTLVACPAHLAPDLTSGLDPRGLLMKEVVREHPLVGRLVLSLAMGLPARIPGMVAPMMRRVLPAPDHAILGTTAMRRHFGSCVLEAFRQGSRGPAHDLALMTGRWDFALADIRCPVDIWQGEADTFGARPAMATFLHRQIPGSRTRMTPGGHLSVMGAFVDHLWPHDGRGAPPRRRLALESAPVPA